MITFTNSRSQKYSEDFPPEKFWIHPDKCTKGIADFQTLIDSRCGEKPIDNYLRHNLELLANCMNFSSFGHHGTWVIPQQQVRPPLDDQHQGLKPDYIVGGKGSDGYKWYVVELKGADQHIFRRRGGQVAFSTAVSDGICQLLNYIDYCSYAQSYLRDVLLLNDFREPEGILIIGREFELAEDKRKEALKAAWNRIVGKRLQIRTYDALLRQNAGRTGGA